MSMHLRRWHYSSKQRTHIHPAVYESVNNIQQISTIITVLYCISLCIYVVTTISIHCIFATVQYNTLFQKHHHNLPHILLVQSTQICLLKTVTVTLTTEQPVHHLY